MICLPCAAVDADKKKEQNEPKQEAGGKLYRVLDARPGAKPVPGKKIKSKDSKSTFIIESGAISFSEMTPGHEKDLPGCVVIRVFSEENWRLKLVATSPLQILDHTDLVPISRLKIRSRATGGFVPFQEARTVLLAQGAKTNPSGDLVLADLRLLLEDEDPVGIYSSYFRVILEVD